MEKGLFFRRADTLELIGEEGVFFRHYTAACAHCDDAVCVLHCPTGAMERSADGSVIHNDEKCIGCGICVRVCPQGAPGLRVSDGRSAKCDGCIDLRAKGKNPACVDACLTHCLTWADLDALEHKPGRKAVFPWA